MTKRTVKIPNPRKLSQDSIIKWARYWYPWAIDWSNLHDTSNQQDGTEYEIDLYETERVSPPRL